MDNITLSHECIKCHREVKENVVNGLCVQCQEKEPCHCAECYESKSLREIAEYGGICKSCSEFFEKHPELTKEKEMRMWGIGNEG